MSTDLCLCHNPFVTEERLLLVHQTRRSQHLHQQYVTRYPTPHDRPCPRDQVGDFDKGRMQGKIRFDLLASLVADTVADYRWFQPSVPFPTAGPQTPRCRRFPPFHDGQCKSKNTKLSVPIVAK